MNSVLEGARSIFLDMNGVLVFGHDRLDRDEDFYATYRACGGTALSHDAVCAAVSAAVTELDRLYVGGAHDCCFPGVNDVLCNQGVSGVEASLLADVIAVHELGTLSQAALRTLPLLAGRFELTLVSNLWSSSALCRKHFADLGMKGCFKVMVFSSDVGINKPAPELFEHALRLSSADPATTVMVGDDYRRDLAPAAALGMRTVRVTATEMIQPGVDSAIASIDELLSG